MERMKVSNREGGKGNGPREVFKAVKIWHLLPWQIQVIHMSKPPECATPRVNPDAKEDLGRWLLINGGTYLVKKKKKNPCIILFNVLIMGTQVMCEMVGTWKICPFLSTLLKWFREALWIYWQGRNGTPIRWDRAIPQHWQLPGAVATAKPEGARWGPVPAPRERESLVGDWPGRRVPFLTVLMSSVSLREGRKHPSLLFPLPSSLVDLHWPKSAWVLRDSGKIETLRVGSGRTNKRRGTRFLTGSLLQKWDHHLCSPATSSFISPTRPNSDFLL